ncbi:MAG: cellulase family glycosylhydrolase [Bacteroidales bacterium]|nr:cellulase family glycosylhydrolase [Bacteroidales bacterium]
MKKLFCFLIFSLCVNTLFAYYTTRGKDIIDRSTGERVVLRGLGLGGWLLPEGYMWGIRQLDRPWQFEKAITDLIGEEKANMFWRIYHENYVTEQDFAAMKDWGLNTVRIPLLASMLQPVKGQPEHPPFLYSEEGFRFLDSIVKWSEKYHLGVIWDMHGAPGAQNKENIADSDGQARLWTEKDIYFPRCIDLWRKIAERYKGHDCITGYDLLNEPLLRRYPEVDRKLLREIYVELTNTIREIDTTGIIFIEGDDWAQTYDDLEPLDWDPHLVIAFHRYPPVSDAAELERWNQLRNKYTIPLWHGETGEQGPPYERNTVSTSFLEQANVGWAWWTHKKFENRTQPWTVVRTAGFNKILEYWKGKGPRPPAEEAEKWLIDQAVKTNSKYCIFLPQMVRSLVPLNPDGYLRSLEEFLPVIIKQPVNVNTYAGLPVSLSIAAVGNNLKYQWYRNGKEIEGANDPEFRFPAPGDETEYQFYVQIENTKGVARSDVVRCKTIPYAGPVLTCTESAPVIDGKIDPVWKNATRLPVNKPVMGRTVSLRDLEGYFRIMYDVQNLYFLFEINDDSMVNNCRERYRNDGIEIYLDTDNDKPAFYSDHEYMIRIVRDIPGVFIDRGKISGDIPMKQENFPERYVAEIAIPWKEIGKFSGEYIGLEVQINDNDFIERDTKYSWYGDKDEVYRSPMLFGVMKVDK